MPAVWTGGEMVVWGGSRGGNDASSAGAAYDPSEDRWEELPAPPIEGRTQHTLVWTGDEVLVWGGRPGGPHAAEPLDDGAAYDPDTKQWRRLPPAPVGGRADHEAVWSGQEMVVWGGYPRCCPIDSVIHDPTVAAYDPASDRWRRLVDMPAPWSGDDGAAVTLRRGTELIVWREHRLARGQAEGDRWTEIPGVPAAPPPPDGAVFTTGDPAAVGVTSQDTFFGWTGPALGGPLEGAARDMRTGQWRRLPRIDGAARAAVAAGDGLIYVGREPVVNDVPARARPFRLLEYSVATDRFTELTPPGLASRSSSTLIWTGEEVLVWGGYAESAPLMDGAAFRPS